MWGLAKIGKEDFLKPDLGKYSTHDRSKDNESKLGGLATVNNVTKSVMFHHNNIHNK